MNDTAFDALRSYITDTTVIDNALAAAQQDAEEFGLAAPDAAAGSLLSALAASYIDEAGVGAIAVTPAAGVVGLYLLRGLGLTGTLTCIDPETEHQRQARTNFMAAGYKPNQFRFLPSRPLEVMSRLAADSYHVVYGDIRPSDYRAFIDAAAVAYSSWPIRCLTVRYLTLPGKTGTPSARGKPMNMCAAWIRLWCVAFLSGLG